MILHLLARGDDRSALSAIAAMGAGAVVVVSGELPSLPQGISVERLGAGGIDTKELIRRIESAERVYCW